MKHETEFAHQLKQARASVGMTQAALAETVGVSPQTISAYEKGEKQPSLDKAAAIAEALEISLDKLCGVRVPRPMLPTHAMGDIARVLLSMQFWETAEFKPAVTVLNDTCPALLFKEGELRAFIADWLELRQQYRKGEVDFAYYNFWLQAHLLDLDEIETNSQDLITRMIERGDELPF